MKRRMQSSVFVMVVFIVAIAERTTGSSTSDSIPTRDESKTIPGVSEQLVRRNAMRSLIAKIEDTAKSTESTVAEVSDTNLLKTLHVNACLTAGTLWMEYLNGETNVETKCEGHIRAARWFLGGKATNTAIQVLGEVLKNNECPSNLIAEVLFLYGTTLRISTDRQSTEESHKALKRLLTEFPYSKWAQYARGLEFGR
jgi:hypothetical protein